MSPIVPSMRSRLLPSSDSEFPTLGKKSFKMWKVLLVSQNSYLSSKSNPIHQNESEGVLSFQNRVRKHKNQNSMQNSAMRLTSKYELFNCSSFGNLETSSGFVTSKRVWEWSRILIWSPCWPYTQMETNFNWQFSLKKSDFRNFTKHRKVTCYCEAFFFKCMNLGSLPLKSSPIGLDQALKFWITHHNELFWKLSSEMEGTHLKALWCWAWWRPDPPEKALELAEKCRMLPRGVKIGDGALVALQSSSAS